MVVVSSRDRVSQWHATLPGRRRDAPVQERDRRTRHPVLLQNRHRGKRRPVPDRSHAGYGAGIHLDRDVACGGRKRSRPTQGTRLRPVQAHQSGHTGPADSAHDRTRLCIARKMGAGIAKIDPKDHRRRDVQGWTFPENASGPFAEDTPGPWRSYETVHKMWEFLRDVDLRFGKQGLGEWFDLPRQEIKAGLKRWVAPGGATQLQAVTSSSRSGRDSSPWSRPRQSPSRTSPWHRRRHRPPPRHGAANAIRR